MERLHERQQNVMRRKIEETVAVNKRLKDALENALRIAKALEGTKELQQLELFRKPEDDSRASVIGKRAPKTRRDT